MDPSGRTSPPTARGRADLRLGLQSFHAQQHQPADDHPGEQS
ncbi:hypothetical protein [Nonomuraea lactucae]|nr:hypothetical protein [Nonomuraea lactucae]